MKSLIVILIYIVLSMGFYLMISIIGLIWWDWNTIIHSKGYNVIYWMVFGWWLAVPVCTEIWDDLLDA